MIGRFAPTPSGPLHFGSLCCALASFIECRVNRGRWRLRIDDIDPPRCVSGSADIIQQQLTDYGLEWDGEIVWQQRQKALYHQALEQLMGTASVYRCVCTRKTLLSQNGFENDFCVKHPPATTAHAALRLKLEGEVSWLDLYQGLHRQDLTQQTELCLRRRDGLYAYALATVVDDIEMGVTHVVRGADLFSAAASHIDLFRLLGHQSPIFGHIPVATSPEGKKLSKQNHAEPIDSRRVEDTLRAALRHLGQESAQATGNRYDILKQAISSWQPQRVPTASALG